MRRTASEVLQELETRVARLERKAWNPFKKKEAPVAPVEEKGAWSTSYPALDLGYKGHTKEVVQMGLNNLVYSGDEETVGDVVKIHLRDMHGTTYVEGASAGDYYRRNLNVDIKKVSVRSVWLEEKSSRKIDLAVVLDVVYGDVSHRMMDGDTWTDSHGGKGTLVSSIGGVIYMFEGHESDDIAIKYLQKKEGNKYFKLWGK